MSEVVLEGIDTMHLVELLINPLEYKGVEISSQQHVARHPDMLNNVHVWGV